MWGAAMDVGGWLRGLGLGQYETNFRDNKIDADLLPRLTEDRLKDIGVSALGDRLRLLDAITALADVKPPGAVPASPSKPTRPKSPEVSAERRPITVMFCDLVGSTSIAAKLDAEDWRNLVNAYLDEASKAVTGLGGHVLKKLGDGLMALFGYPQAQENDAERAVRAALAIQRALSEINGRNASKGLPELSARIGIESGPVVVDATGEVFGDAPNVAARVQAAAEPGSVLVTINIQRQVAGLFVAEEQAARELKGVAQPVQLFRIVRASGAGRRIAARALTPFVGREEELGLLMRRWARAKGGEGQLVLIFGEPGLGKSRIIEEFHARLAQTPHTWVEWSASQLLQNTPLHPIAEWGRQRFGGADVPAEQRLADLESTLRQVNIDSNEAAPLLAPLVDIPLPQGRAGTFAPEELRRRQLATVVGWIMAGARTQPIVLAFEDLQWADPTSIDVLRALAERGAQAPLLLLATARPEFRAPWSLRSHHIVISLSPLDRAGVAQMVSELSARHALSREVVEGVSQRTGGVPLFVEEVTRLLLERGEQGGVQAIPPTLQQSLAARLDRLGAAREIAQIGAVLGRDFAYTLLRDAADIDEPSLQASLDRLADADLLLVEGAPPQANYRFKHALIQDAAYDSLLRSRREALHRRAAELLRDDPERASAEPEVIAHHFTQAGHDDLAIEWWGKAGDQALRRSAFQEAIAHLGKAIQIADRGEPGGRTTDPNVSDPMGLRYKHARALIYAKGLAAEETKAALERAGDGASVNEDILGVRLRFNQHYFRGEFDMALAVTEHALRAAEDQGRAADAALLRVFVGVVRLWRGDLRHAGTLLEQTARECASDLDAARPAESSSGAETVALATTYLSLATWHLGDPAAARCLIDQAEVLARRVGRLTSIFAITARMFLEGWRSDAGATVAAADQTIAMASESGMPLMVACGAIYKSWASGRLHDAATGLHALREALQSLDKSGGKAGTPYIHGLAADLEARQGNMTAALKEIDQGLAISGETGEHLQDPHLHCLRGSVLLQNDPPDPIAAENAYRTAIAIADGQGARSYVLLASLANAKLYQSTGRPAEAHAVLAPALEGFAPTPEMPEVAEAQVLLAVLAETDEVKSVIAHRQRRLDLQTSYGHALMWGKGFDAEETKTAFARVGEIAGALDSSAARFAAYDGQCLSSFVRGELRSARTTAETFLREAEAEERLTEAGATRRMLGLVLLFQGELKAARFALERALADYIPERDGNTQFRFGRDTEVCAAAYLGLAEWLLGNGERARNLMDRSLRRANELNVAAARANALFWRTVLECSRNDASAARASSDALMVLAEEHGIQSYAAVGQVYLSWARGRVEDDPDAGARELSRALASLLAQGHRSGDPLACGLLAELEATARGPDAALATIDQGLAIAEHTGEHFTDPYLHRLRGEILLKRNPADRAPAEDAYQTAIAVAKEQGARSYHLQAALPLAQLYQSTGRPTEAHAVLAPALEGFTPTPEMPEIAEAQALMERLA
jgi:class 3 adenylate cyclase/predicted ATPase